MTVLKDYQHFGGRHWETGSVHNFFAYRGVRAPHTGKPYSEALLLGVSGGIAVGYFTFAYEGHDPQCIILTRNTFDPLNRMLPRLGIVQDVQQTAKPDKAVEILLDTLADGSPAILWADMWSLPHNALPTDGMWGSVPILVYGYDREADRVLIADRATVPLTITGGELAAARGRLKKDKHRLMTLDIPDPAKLESAVRLGITECIQLFTEKPPRGTPNNFGLQALQFWAQMLTDQKGRSSWATLFPPGLPMYAGLTWVYRMAFLYGQGLESDAERGSHADFLDEAAVILAQPALSKAADRFRASAEAWRALPPVLLPDHIPPFARARRLMWERHERFLGQGNAAVGDMKAIDAQLAEIRRSMRDDFPLTEAEAVYLREQIAQQVLRIHDLEREAVLAMKEAMQTL